MTVPGEGFKIADAFVEIHAKDDGLKEEVKSSTEKAAEGAKIPIPEEIKPGSIEELKAQIDQRIRDMGLDPAKVKVEVKEDQLALLKAKVAEDVKAAGLGQSVKVKLEEDKPSWDQVGKDLSKSAEQMGSGWMRTFIGAGMTMVGPLASELTSMLAATLGATTAGVQQLSGAIGVVPAVAVAAKTSLAALQIGVSGFGAAIKTANTAGELKAQQQALDQLTPAAKAAAEQVIKLRPAWKGLEDAVQEATFKGVKDDIAALGTRDIPALRSGLAGMASEWNVIIRDVLQFATAGRTVQDLRGFLDNATTAMHNMTPAITPILDIFRNILAVGGSFLPGLATGFTNAATAASNFVQNARDTGKLHDWIQGGLDAVRALWGWFRELIHILGDFAEVGKTIMPQFFGGIGQGTKNMADFVDKAKESGKLADWMKEGMRAFQDLGVIIKNLIVTFQNLSASPLGFMSTMRLVTDMLAWMSEHVPGLIPIIGALFVAFKVAQVAKGLMDMSKTIGTIIQLTKDWKVAQVGLNLVMDANPIAIVILAIAALGFAIYEIITHWTTVKRWLGEFWEWLKGFFKDWGPLTLVILAPFIGIPLEIYLHWDQIKGFLGKVWDSVSGFIGTWGPVALAILVPFIGIPLLIYQHWDQIKGFLKQAWDGALGVIHWAIDEIGRALNWFAGLGRMAYDWFMGFNQSCINVMNSVVDFIWRLPGRFLSALGDLGGLLVRAGWDLLQGLLRGIKQGAEDVYNYVSGIAGKIAALKGPLDYDAVLLTPHGNVIMQGLIKGLQAQMPALESQLKTVVAKFQNTSAGINLAVSGPGQVVGVGGDSGIVPGTAGAGSQISIGNLHLNVAGNLDPSNPVAWRQTVENLRKAIRDVERSYT